MHEDFDPAKVEFRESRDSDKNPESTPIVIGSDVTGSMGMLAEQIIKKDLGPIMEMIYDRKPVTDPQIMLAAIGDTECDSAPLQVSQFEASIVLAEQLAKFYLEGGGGGNGGESYPLLWVFTGYKVKTDIIKKRHKKGYIFTIGDESPLLTISKGDLKRFLNLDAQADMHVPTMLKTVQQDWHVFHLIVKPVPSQQVQKDWEALLGDHAVMVQDLSKLADGIVSIIQIVEGQNVPEAQTEALALTNLHNSVARAA